MRDVTGDEDLLSLARKFSCPFITAGQFLTTLENG